MDKEKEMEGMANELHCATNESFISCRNIARILVERRGYGNIEQAVKEFAENKVKPIIEEIVDCIFGDIKCKVKAEDCRKSSDHIPCGASFCVEENKKIWKNKIDELIKERE